MPSYRLSEVARMCGVSDDTVRRWVEAGRLPATRDAGERLAVDGPALAGFLTDLAAAADRLPTEPVVARSARNQFPGIVTRVVRDGVMAQVELQAGPHRVVSLLSAEAVDELGLEVGVAAVAVVKATNVVVEIPGARR